MRLALRKSSAAALSPSTITSRILSTTSLHRAPAPATLFRPRHPAICAPRPPRRTMTTMASARPGASVCFPRAASSSVASLVDLGADAAAVTIECVGKDGLEGWLAGQGEATRAWIAATEFKAKEGEVCVVPGPSGGIDRVVAGLEDADTPWSYSGLPSKLPAGTYVLAGAGVNPTSAALGWALGTYSFDRYKSKKAGAEEAGSKGARLAWPAGADRAAVAALAQGFFLARDMITTPAEDMAPQDIAAEAVALAQAHGAAATVIVGDDLLAEGYPAVHTVGRASVNPPHLVDLRWAPAGAAPEALPRVTLVGKGVSFDTGGLDLKPAAAMKLMKKDMGGSALVLALAHAVMATGLRVRLRVLVPTVENSVSGNAFRPLDVLQTRAGITVENGNTDAEGRLILCDALAEAVAEGPELLIDAATLTGAARVALGTELPALFCNHDGVAEEILAAGRDVNDPLWRLPLHAPYRKMLDSKVADIYSCSEGGYGGAITAALFLQEFVKDAPAWVHIDTMGYQQASKPGRPEGGEAFTLRALYEFLKRRYPAAS